MPKLITSCLWYDARCFKSGSRGQELADFKNLQLMLKTGCGGYFRRLLLPRLEQKLTGRDKIQCMDRLRRVYDCEPGQPLC